MVMDGEALKERHLLPIRVYYEDTDFSGIVYHASYLRFMERGRTELLRARGISQIQLAEGSYGDACAFVVRDMKIDFLRPGRMDDELLIETTIESVGGASVSLNQRVLREDTILVTAAVRLAVIGSNGRAKILPPPLMAVLTGR
ncbi:tol-pal system-associated acyl-CoA thioesterase [Beijerinckia mobilis]|uniref:tol-pal system-associated acyl-CoA thioesterase n=1 Tax=Beijerinckia mobilis TaxID=231434 RepID=UPI000B0429A8|nr:tol-pal system-associated acyl-CoA thioesterase [Beijerinckia mobilis]